MRPIAAAILRDVIPQAPIFATVDAAAAAGTTVQLATRQLRTFERAGLIVQVVRGLWAAPNNPDFTPYAVVPYLLHGDRSQKHSPVQSWSTSIEINDQDDDDHEPRQGHRVQAATTIPSTVAGYVSFISALALHGMLSQIPREVHVAVRVQREPVVTPVWTYRFHQIGRNFFDGAVPADQRARYYVATPAKALVDTLYVSTRRGRQFSHLPELDLPYVTSLMRYRQNEQSAQTAPLRQERLATFESEVRNWIARIPSARLREAVKQRWCTLRPMFPDAL